MIYIMSGIPASGKSTYIEDHAVEGSIVLSRDNYRTFIRQTLGSDKYFPISEKGESEGWYNLIAETIDATHYLTDIWIDQTTITIQSLKHLLYGVPIRNDTPTAVVHMNTPIADCIARNAQRTGFDRVPNDVILRMNSQYNLSYAMIREKLPEYRSLVWLEALE